MYAVIHPGEYINVTDDISVDGLHGSLLCADLLKEFIISIIVMFIGLFICGYEAYRKNQSKKI